MRNDRLREEAEERRVRAQLRQKEISEKEAAAVLKVIIAEVKHSEGAAQLNTDVTKP